MAQVRVVDESGRAVSEPIPALPLSPGHLFDFAQERESLRKLYAMGDFSDIRVAAVPEPAGLSVDFIVKRNYYNNVIQIEGLQEPPTEPAALAALRLNLGEPFRESALREAVGRLEDTLHSEGLYLAKVTWLLGPHEDTRQMNIYITVDPGPRAKLGIFAIDNQTPYTDLELLKRSKLSVKNEMTSARLTRASQRLKSYLVGQGYLGGAAVITPGTYDAKNNRIPLMMSVTAGPRVRVEISGAHISTGQRRKLLPIYAEGAVDDDLLQEGRRNIRDYLERAGYFNADVDVTSRQEKDKNGRDERVISYEVNRGDRFRLAGISFTGNKYFSNELLARQLQLQTASFQSSGRFSQQLLRNDVDSIRAMYLSNGFRDVQVTSDIDDTHRGKKNNLFVTFHLVEGTQSRVADLKFDGNQALSTADLLAVTGSTPGQPFSESAIASDRNNILAMYYNDGFPGARFDEEITPASKPNEFRLVYHITEGQRVEVSKVLLTGYQFTRPGIIRREVAIKPEGPLRESDVVDTQRRLYNLGVFNRVQIAPQNPNGADPQKAVVVDTEEGHRYTIGYGGGFEVQTLAGGSTNPDGTIIGASPRGIFEIARSNMFGRAQTLSFRVRASTLQYRAALSYSANNLSITILSACSSPASPIKRRTSTPSLPFVTKVPCNSSKKFRHRVLCSTAISIAAWKSRRLTTPSVLKKSRCSASPDSGVSGFGVTYARDRRDNPSDAKHGNFNTVDLSVASTALASSADFFRASFQTPHSHPLGATSFSPVPCASASNKPTATPPKASPLPARPPLPPVLAPIDRSFAGTILRRRREPPSGVSG